MAKSKSDVWRTSDGLLKLSAWARDGLSDEQIAKNCGISRSTLSEWKNKYPDISHALKKGKEVVDIEVENSLHKRAMGYTAKIKKNFKVKTIEYDDCGKKLREVEELKEAYDEVHIPADVTAIIFWLKNRKPKDWRDKREIESESGNGMLQELIEGVINGTRKEKETE